MSTPLTFYGTPVVIFPPSILARKFDVIHASFPSPYLAAVSAYLSLLKKNASVLTWHNDLPKVTSGAGILVKTHERLSPVYLQYYDRIIATTQSYAASSSILTRHENKVRIVRNGVDTDRFNPMIDGEGVRSRYGITQNRVALFVGALTTFHAYKGVDILIRSFQHVSHSCPDARLLIVGGGNLLSNYKKIAVELGINDRVIFAGYIPDNALPQFYAACDITVLPSKDASEGFGLVLLEAMATGKPVVGSRVGGIPDVISDELTGLMVPPNSEGDLSEAIISLFNDAEKRKRMGVAAREFADSISWYNVAKRVESVYKEIC